MRAAIKRIFYKITSSIKKSTIHPDAEISYMVKFYNSSIGANSYVSNNCNVFHADIGKYCSIGLGCNIGGGEHPTDWVSTSPVFHSSRTFRIGVGNLQYSPYKKTIIGNDVWIAPNVIVKTGVHIADGAIIGGGAVVTKDVGPYEIWAGNPARQIRKRFPDDTINELIRIAWWDWDKPKIVKYSEFFNNPEIFIEMCKKNGDM